MDERQEADNILAEEQIWSMLTPRNGLGWVIKIGTQPNGFWVGLGYRWVTQQKNSASVNDDY